MEDFLKQYEGLTLRDDEKKEAETQAAGNTNDLSLMLVGRIMAHRKIPHGSVAAVFEKVWAANGSVTASPVAENTTLFQFSDLADKERVLEREPWLFDKNEQHLMVLSEPKPGSTAEDLEFRYTPFWIHVHGVPWERKNEATAREIGDDIGRYIGAEKDKWGRMMGSYLRIRVAVDITKPIKRCQALKGVKNQLPLVYEKLPQLCSYCGVMGHGRGDCSARLRAPRSEREVEHYPSFLRAGPNQSPFPKEHRRDGTVESRSWRPELGLGDRRREEKRPVVPEPEPEVIMDVGDTTIALIPNARGKDTSQMAPMLKKPGPVKRVDVEKPDSDWWFKVLQENHKLHNMSAMNVDQEEGSAGSKALTTSNHGIHEQVRSMMQGMISPVRIEEIQEENSQADMHGEETEQLGAQHERQPRVDDVIDVDAPTPPSAGSQVALMRFSAEALVVSPARNNNVPMDPLSPFLVPVPIDLDTPAKKLEEQKARLAKSQGKGRGGGRGRRPAVRKLLQDEDMATDYADMEVSGSLKRKVKNDGATITGSKKSKVSTSNASFDGVASDTPAETGNVVQSRQAP